MARARALLTTQDSILQSFPEVERVWGKAGRAETATDPAGLDMIETTISLKPESAWRPGITLEGLIDEMDRAVRMPGSSTRGRCPSRGASTCSPRVSARR